ncbi:MAG: transposase [Pseudolabrys sp.]
MKQWRDRSAVGADLNRVESNTSYMRLLLSGGKASLPAGDFLRRKESSDENVCRTGRFKRAAVCVVDGSGRIVWRSVVDTHAQAIAVALRRWPDELEKVGLECGSMSPWLARGLAALGSPVVGMDARRAADAVKSRRVKSDKADAFALAEMLRTGWCSAVHVKSEDGHRLKALLGARDQLVRAKRALGNQVRGLLRPFGIRLLSHRGTKKFAAAAHQTVAHDAMLSASVTALMEALSATARRYGIARSQLLQWRRSFRAERKEIPERPIGFVPAVVVSESKLSIECRG